MAKRGPQRMGLVAAAGTCCSDPGMKAPPRTMARVWLGALAFFAAGPLLAQSSAPDAFSIVLLPDTQGYTEEVTFDIYRHQTEWIAGQRKARNIEFVIHLGDITQFDVGPEWQLASDAHAVLDRAGVPYVMTSGNHDLFPYHRVHRRQSQFSRYFGPKRFADQPWYGGHFQGASENSFSRFESQGHRWLVLSVEFVPRKDVVTWANDVIRQHPDHHVIVATHAHSNPLGGYTSGEAAPYHLAGREGVDLWKELLSRHSNLFLVVSGHVPGVSYHRRAGNAGNPVHEILTDFQQEPVRATDFLLGNGWLRVLKVNPTAGTVDVETLSVEDGNPAVFPGGVARLFDRYDYIRDPSETRHNRVDFTFRHDFRTARTYSYAPTDRLYKDRVVHTSLTGEQRYPRIARTPQGTVVVWEARAESGDLWRALARVFDADGNATTGDVLVAESVRGGASLRPTVAADAAGNFVVAWQQGADGDGRSDVYARGFGQGGGSRFDARLVNSAAGQHRLPSIAMDAKGGFVVVWSSEGAKGEGTVLARSFAPHGSPRLAERRLGATDGGGQPGQTAIAMGSDGRYVIAWVEAPQPGGSDTVLASGFGPDGFQSFTNLRIDGSPAGRAGSPAVAMGSEGRFVVAWQDNSAARRPPTVRVRGFNAAGEEQMPETRATLESEGAQHSPSVAVDAAGHLAVVFAEDRRGASDVVASRFEPDGERIGFALRVSSDASGPQTFPCAAVDGSGRLTVAWQDDMDGDGSDSVMLRNFDLLIP